MNNGHYIIRRSIVAFGKGYASKTIVGIVPSAKSDIALDPRRDS